MKRLSLMERRAGESGAHPLGASKPCGSAELIDMAADALENLDEPEQTETGLQDRAVLPSEKIMMQHFAAHYQVFLESLTAEIEEAFLISQADKIRLYSIYCDNWGQTRK